MSTFDESSNNVSMNFVYSNQIIGEIRMGLTKMPVQYEAR